MRHLSVLFVFFLSLPSSGFAGQVIYKGLYIPQDILIGEGNSLNIAIHDALAAMPSGYISDQKNSWAIECTMSPLKESSKNQFTCDLEIVGNRYRVVQPIVQAEEK